MVPLGYVVYTHRRSSTDVIGLSSLILAVIGSHVVVYFHSFVVIFVRTIISSIWIFSPNIVLVIHVLAWRQFIDFHLFIIIGACVRIIDLYGYPFRIQLLVVIGCIFTNRFLGIFRMSKGSHAVACPQDNVFRSIFYTSIPRLRVFLNRNDFIILAYNQISLRIIGGIGICSLGGCIFLIFDIHCLIGRRIPTVCSCCLNPVWSSKERRRQDKGCQNRGFTTASATAAAYMAIVMVLGQFRHDDVTISCFTPNNFKDFIHRISPLFEYIS